MSDYVYSGFVTTALNGVKQGIIDLGETPWRKIVPELDMATNTSYKVYVLPCKGNATEVFCTASRSRFASGEHGAAFTNQPSAEHLDIVSASALDTSQTLTIYAASTSDTVNVVKYMVSLKGATTISLFSADSATGTFGNVLAWELDAATAGNVTVTGSGGGDVFTVTAGVLSAGVVNVTSTSQKAFGLPVYLVSAGDSTKIIGVWGETTTKGTGEAIALTGTTAVYTTNNFNSVTKILHGDLESSAHAVTAGLYGIPNTGIKFSDMGADKLILENPYRYLLWSSYNGTTMTNAGAADRLQTALYG